MSAQKAAQGAPEPERVRNSRQLYRWVHSRGLQVGLFGPSWGVLGALLGPSWGPLGPLFVNPSALLVCNCPVRRNRSGSRGPLSRLLGGYFHNLVRSRELTPIPRFTRVNPHSYWRAIAFWNVYCHTWPVSSIALGRIVLDEKREIYITIKTTDLLFKTQYAISRNTAHSHTRKRLSLLLTNPHLGGLLGRPGAGSSIIMTTSFAYENAQWS